MVIQLDATQETTQDGAIKTLNDDFASSNEIVGDKFGAVSMQFCHLFYKSAECMKSSQLVNLKNIYSKKKEPAKEHWL